MPPPLDLRSSDAPSASSCEPSSEPAFEHIVERYAPLVHARCRRALAGADASDATQAVFWVLAQRSEQAAASPALVAWLMRVTENVVRNALRDRQRRSRAERAAGTSPSTVTAVGDDLELEELKDHLDQAMAGLPAAEREALTLHYLAGHSVAETAALTASGLSTIKDRLQRGAERLRAQLLRKGYHESDVALLALLPRLCPPVPTTLLNQLRALPQQPSTALPPHIRRWSRQGPSMTTIVSTVLAASLLCAVGAFASLHGADAPGAAAVGRDEGTAPSAATTNLADIYAGMIPERAASYAQLSWHDGVRTAARLARLPEMELLPDHGQALTQQIASVRSGSLLVRADSMVPHALTVTQYQFEHDTARLPPKEKLQRMLARVQEQMDRSIAQAKNHQPLQISIPALTGSVQLSAPDAAVLATLRGYLARAQLLGCSVTAHDPQWLLSHGPSHLTIALQGPQLCLSSESAYCQAPVFPPLASFPSTAPDSELEVMQSLDNGTGRISQLWDVAFSITPEGLHFASTFLPQEGFGPSQVPQPVIDRTTFDRLPSDTLLAAVYALQPASSATSALIHSMINSLKMTDQARPTPSPDTAIQLRIFDRLQDALLQIDGQVMLYVEPGPLLPLLTITADLPKAPSLALITALGAPVSEDGSTVIHSGLMSLTLGWNHGQLICTSSPDGLAVGMGKQGFTQHPEIQHALAAAGHSGDPQALVLLRPEALVQTLSAFAPLLSPQMGGLLPGYQKRLADQNAYGYFTMTNGVTGTRMEASGMLAFVAAACLAMQVHMPEAAN